MEVKFVKISPTENMTVIVTSPVEREKQLAIGTELIKYSSVYAEQAGFMEKPQNPKAAARLQMMAGEFCGNGTMSAAVYTAWKKGIQSGETAVIPMEVSGADGILDCMVWAVDAEKGKFEAQVSMPLPEKIEQRKIEIDKKTYDVTAVVLPGIVHMIIPAGLLGEDFREKLERNAQKIGENIDDDAFGLIVFDEEKSEINPLVAVKSAKSLCWERGCGSGSEAVGIYMADRLKRDVKLRLKQPGGTIETSVVYENGIKSASIKGAVKIAAEGSAFTDC